MAKKRRCRRDEEEIRIHDEAVKLRRMTDRQLVGACRMAEWERIVAKKPRQTTEVANTDALMMVLKGIDEGKIKGMGKVTSYKISDYAKQIGVLADG